MREYSGPQLVLVAILATACAQPAEQAPPVDLVAEEVAATVVVDQWTQLLVDEDLELLSQTFAHDPDMVIFGTDAAEVWVGYEAFRASMETMFAAFEDTELVARDQVVKVHGSGEVAWFSEILDWQVTSGGERASFEGLRFTGVLEKRNGDWMIVQFHGSVPVAGQAAEY